MEENKKKKRTAGDVIRTLIMIVALGVFCYSGFQLFSIYREYKKGSDEYSSLEEKYIDEKGMLEEIEAEEPTSVIRSHRAKIMIIICTIRSRSSQTSQDVFLWITDAKKIFPIRIRSFTDTI